MSAVLERIGRIVINPKVAEHRFTREVLANAMLAAGRDETRNRVVGTRNSHEVELYGWGGSVGAHADNTGWIYFCPLLIEGRCTVRAEPWHAEPLHLDLAVGDVVRLWDHCEHSTVDEGPVACMFLGSFEQPCDEEAIAAFRRGAKQLARGSYYKAPRASPGFQLLLPDECIAATRDMEDTEVMLLADAKRRGRWVQKCWCGENAVRLDNHWPYDMSRNRCVVHVVELPEAA